MEKDFNFSAVKKRLKFKKEILSGKNPTTLFTGDHNKTLVINTECSDDEKQRLWDEGYHFLFDE